MKRLGTHREGWNNLIKTLYNYKTLYNVWVTRDMFPLQTIDFTPPDCETVKINSGEDFICAFLADDESFVEIHVTGDRCVRIPILYKK